MSEILEIASRINLEDENFEDIMGVMIGTELTCLVKRNKESITMIFKEEF